jgi:hypothetical protein
MKLHLVLETQLHAGPVPAKWRGFMPIRNFSLPDLPLATKMRAQSLPIA